MAARAAASMALLQAWLQPLPLGAAPTMPPKHIMTTGSLNFGRFAGGGGGTITIGINGARTRTGAVVLLPSTTAAARYTIGASGSGNENRAYILTLPANGTVSMTSGANRMAVTSFVASGPGNGTLPSGTQTLTVGATLQVAARQPRGNYTGVFPVILEYQ